MIKHNLLLKNSSCGKVIFSRACVCSRGEVYLVPGAFRGRGLGISGPRSLMDGCSQRRVGIPGEGYGRGQVSQREGAGIPEEEGGYARLYVSWDRYAHPFPRHGGGWACQGEGSIMGRKGWVCQRARRNRHFELIYQVITATFHFLALCTWLFGTVFAKRGLRSVLYGFHNIRTISSVKSLTTLATTFNHSI